MAIVSNHVKAIIINEYGTIEVSRGGSLRKLFCPHKRYEDKKTNRLEASFCGHECALFGEPQFDNENKEMTIFLCQGSFTCAAENFRDQRFN